MGTPERRSNIRTNSTATQKGRGEITNAQTCQGSDVRLRDEVNACLCANQDIDVSDIRVSIERGAVCLQGTTASHVMRTRIVDLVSDCAAVELIRNSIRLADQ